MKWVVSVPLRSCIHVVISSSIFFFCVRRPRHALLLSKAEKGGKKNSLTNSWKIYSSVSFDWMYAFCPLLCSGSVRLLFRVDIFSVRFVSFDNRMKSRVCMFKAIFIFFRASTMSVGTPALDTWKRKSKSFDGQSDASTKRQKAYHTRYHFRRPTGLISVLSILPKHTHMP